MRPVWPVVVDRSELGRAQEDDVSSVQRYVAEADACAGRGVRAAHQLRSERAAHDCERVTARDRHADGGCVVGNCPRAGGRSSQQALKCAADRRGIVLSASDGDLINRGP